MHVICCYRVFGSAFLRRDAESEDARKMPDREEKAGKKQGYEKNLLLFTPTPVIGFLESVGKCAEIEKIFIHSK